MSGAQEIQVQDLTKTFGGVTAVDHVSFTVNKGEILGFLGPNGAGKTTTMRILTGFMPATSGTARVAGFDVFEQSMEVRRHIGYLPENPPLYPDMTVGEYLDFVTRIKDVPADKRARARGRCIAKDQYHGQAERTDQEAIARIQAARGSGAGRGPRSGCDDSR